MLTRALQEAEGIEGFNKATVGLLHDSATIGTGAGAEVGMLTHLDELKNVVVWLNKP
jgi:hypothetical protein